MKKEYSLLILAFLMSSQVIAQEPIIVDLADNSERVAGIELNAVSFQIINKSPSKTYTASWTKKRKSTPHFTMPSTSGGGESLDKSCNDSVVNSWEAKINIEERESEIKNLVEAGLEIINQLPEGGCKELVNSWVHRTTQLLNFPYKDNLNDNEIVTLTIISNITGADGRVKSGKFVYNFSTPERTPWLVHYGLTYTPSALNRIDKFYSLADTSEANKYTVTKENENSNKPWENISATINFTYPFSRTTKGFDSGFTAGFGLSSGFDLSGHAGLSAIIGENVILSSGFAMMQKYRLKGVYKQDQIIKENLNFESLHEKVWLPEVFITLGFRFGSNPFAKKETPKPAEEPKK